MSYPITNFLTFTAKCAITSAGVSGLLKVANPRAAAVGTLAAIATTLSLAKIGDAFSSVFSFASPLEPLALCTVTSAIAEKYNVTAPCSNLHYAVALSYIPFATVALAVTSIASYALPVIAGVLAGKQVDRNYGFRSMLFCSVSGVALITGESFLRGLDVF